MKIHITAAYLSFWTDDSAPPRRMQFRQAGRLVAEYQIRFAFRAEGFQAWLDVRRFLGQEIEVFISPELDADFRQTEEMELPDLYREPLRPQVHFTVKNGWNNDPNGLIFLDGRYHMYYQYGPCSTHWNNMHWGHAASSDLIHWEELPCALCPGPDGMPFSGSAVLDVENRAGLGRAALFFYTATGSNFTLERGGENFTQHLAYIPEGGRELRLYGENPILPHVCSGNRDPFVVFCEELDCYLMALYHQRDEFGLYRSDDLLHWEFFQTLRLPGDEECPNFYPIWTENGRKKWIFTGAHDIYTVGSFRSGLFAAEQEAVALSFGGVIYASQCIANLKDRVTRIAYEQLGIPSSRFSQQMGIPTDMGLIGHDGGYLLTAWPVPELSALWEEEVRRDAFSLCGGEACQFPASGCSADVEIRFSGAPEGTAVLSILGVEMRLDFSRGRFSAEGVEAPLSRTGRPPRLRAILDRCSAEVFLDGGTVLAAFRCQTDSEPPALRLEAGGNLTIESLRFRRLRSIWPE